MLDFKNNIAKIGGWLTETEGIFLYETAKKVKQQNVIVEIGSWKGKSTICLGRGVEDGHKAKIYAIDPHNGSSEHQKMFEHVDTYQRFIDNTKNANVAQYIEPIRETSENASRQFNESIEFLFIDGAHEFEFVRLDIKLWFSKLIDGGIIAFHDTWVWYGPHLVTAIELLTSSKIKNPKLIGTITCFQKIEKNSFLDRINNVCFLIYRTLFGWIGGIGLRRKDFVLK